MLICFQMVQARIPPFWWWRVFNIQKSAKQLGMQVPWYCNCAMKQHGVMKLVRIPPTHVNPHLSLRHRKQGKMATCSLSSPHEMQLFWEVWVSQSSTSSLSRRYILWYAKKSLEMLHQLVLHSWIQKWEAAIWTSHSKYFITQSVTRCF